MNREVQTFKTETKSTKSPQNVRYPFPLQSEMISYCAVPRGGVDYHFDIESIDDIQQYTHLLQVLRTCNPEDDIHLHIDSQGGDLMLAAKLVTNMLSSNARSIIAHGEGLIASAATLIFLSCSEWQVSPLSSFMFHTSSLVSGGQMPDVIKQLDAHREHLILVTSLIYHNFFTEEEIKSIVIDGNDIWLAADDVNKRLKTKIQLDADEDDEHRAEKEEELIQQARRLVATCDKDNAETLSTINELFNDDGSDEDVEPDDEDEEDDDWWKEEEK